MSEDDSSTAANKIKSPLAPPPLHLAGSAPEWIYLDQVALQKKILPWLTAVVGLGAASTWIFIGSNYNQPAYWIMNSVLTLSFGLLLWAKRLTRHNRAAAAGYLIVSVFSLIAIGVSIAYADMIVTGAILGLFITLLAAVLISPAASYKFVGFFLVTTMVLVILIVTEKLDPPEVPRALRHIINLLTYAWTLFFGTYLMGQYQARVHKALAQLFDQSGTLKAYNDQLQKEVAERRAAKQSAAQKAGELARSNAFLSALNRLTIHFEHMTDPAKIIPILGEELKALGISCLLGLLDPVSEDWVANYISISSPLLAGIEKMVGIPIVGSRIPKSLWDGHFRVDPGQAVCITDPTELTSALFPQIPKQAVRTALRAAGITAETEVLYLSLATENKTIGIVTLWGGGVTQADIPALTIFAGQIAAAIENARLFQASRKQLDDLKALLQVSITILRPVDQNLVLKTVLQETGRLLHATSAYLCAWEEDTGTATVTAEWFGPDANPKELVSDLGEPYSEDAAFIRKLKNGQSYIFRRADENLDPEWREHLEAYGGQVILFLPLLAQDRLLAHIEVWESRGDRVFSPAELLLAHNLAGLAATAVQNARLYEEIRQHTTNLEQEVARQTRELKQAYAHLKDLDRLKSKFIDDISHELRTPVTTLGLYLDLLEKGNPEKRTYYLGILMAQKERLIRLVEGVIRLSALDLLKGEVEFTAVQVNNVVGEVLSKQRQRTNALNLSLTYTPAPDLALISGNPEQLEEAISQIISNAINYTPEGQIDVTTGPAPGEPPGVCLAISDTGIGIPEEDIRHLFERFYRGKNVSETDSHGLGLGLAIAKGIVDLHNGRIDVESKLGAGTTVRLWLPAAQP